MIRAIVAIDEKRGMANDHGIPWQGKIPTDVEHFREASRGSAVLMGYATYKEFPGPMPERKNFVASIEPETLRPGFELVTDAVAFLKQATEDIWVIGGPGLLAQTLDQCDELSITQLQGEYGCTKFFPEFKDKFVLKEESQPITEGGITYTFQTWTKK